MKDSSRSTGRIQVVQISLLTSARGVDLLPAPIRARYQAECDRHRRLYLSLRRFFKSGDDR